MLVLAGCPGPDPRFDAGSRDAGPRIEIDAGAPVDLDTDEDGLCDNTEVAMGTDPSVADTDSDGLTDRIEVELGYRPLQAMSPERRILIFMEETELATQQLAIPLEVNSDGQSYQGSFEPLPVFDTLELTAADFVVDARASAAMPEENVFRIDATEQNFVGVFGRTQLVWDLRFAFGANLPRSCIRAYPFLYQVKRDDGRRVLLEDWLLVVLPAGQRLNTAEWCVPEGGCI